LERYSVVRGESRHSEKANGQASPPDIKTMREIKRLKGKGKKVRSKGEVRT